MLQGPSEKVIRACIWAALPKPSARAVKGEPCQCSLLSQVRLSMSVVNNAPWLVRQQTETKGKKKKRLKRLSSVFATTGEHKQNAKSKNPMTFI